jgi:hypothetical protein
VKWIQIFQCGNQMRDFVRSVINFWVPLNGRILYQLSNYQPFKEGSESVS